MTKTTWPSKQGHMTPPAYDFRDGLRIWQDGQIVAVIPPNFYGNLAMDLVKEMRKKLDD